MFYLEWFEKLITNFTSSVSYVYYCDYSLFEEIL